MGWTSEIELGTVGEWVSGLGTAGALIVGAVALRHEWENRQTGREEARLEQARLVTWYVPNSSTDGGMVARYNRITYAVANNMVEPIFDVRATFSWPHGQRFVYESTHIPAAHSSDLFVVEELLSEQRRDPSDPSITIEFTDYLEARWRRDELGRVRRATQPRSNVSGA